MIDRGRAQLLQEIMHTTAGTLCLGKFWNQGLKCRILDGISTEIWSCFWDPLDPLLLCYGSTAFINISLFQCVWRLKSIPMFHMFLDITTYYSESSKHWQVTRVLSNPRPPLFRVLRPPISCHFLAQYFGLTSLPTLFSDPGSALDDGAETRAETMQPPYKRRNIFIKSLA